MVEDPIWFVPKEEVQNYESEMTKGKIFPCKKGSPFQSNEAMDYCFKQNMICLLLDDDIDGFNRIIDKKTLEAISYEEAIDDLYTNLKNSPMKMGGFAFPTNLFWFNPLNRISLKSTIPSVVCMIKPCDLRHDTNLPHSYDYDYALQHIVKYGAALRINYIRVVANQTPLDNKKLTFKKTMEGGIDYQIEDVKKAYYYMKTKWGNKVRDSKVPYQLRFNV